MNRKSRHLASMDPEVLYGEMQQHMAVSGEICLISMRPLGSIIAPKAFELFEILTNRFARPVNNIYPRCEVYLPDMRSCRQWWRQFYLRLCPHQTSGKIWKRDPVTLKRLGQFDQKKYLGTYTVPPLFAFTQLWLLGLAV